MKKKIRHIFIVFLLLFNFSCSDQELISSATVAGLLVYVATLDQSDRINHDGEVYFRTISCNPNLYYFDATGYEYYVRNCIIRNDKAYITFGLSSLLLAVLIYKR